MTAVTFFAGIDVGSSATKAIILDVRLDVLGHGLRDSGADFEGAAAAAFADACRNAGLSEDRVDHVVATGYGRRNVAFATATRTEIDCHGRGAFHEFPHAMTVIDIGGQDNKVIVLDDAGRRVDFSMNRKCAAGTGAFLEEIAMRMRIPLDRLSDLAAESTDLNVKIGSYCTVFAMTEILSQIRHGVKPADLARAALESVARRILETKVVTGTVVATGGVVAHFPAMKEVLGRILGVTVRIPSFPQHCGALGAALFAERLTRQMNAEHDAGVAD